MQVVNNDKLSFQKERILKINIIRMYKEKKNILNKHMSGMYIYIYIILMCNLGVKCTELTTSPSTSLKSC